jgi:excisionase family DNA binding protein
MPETLLTPSEAARVLAVTKTRLYRLVGAGVIPTVRLGRSLRFSPAALEALIRSERVEPRPEATAHKGPQLPDRASGTGGS